MKQKQKMPTMIQAIIFDFGNVLLEWNPRYLYRRYFDDAESMEQFLQEVNFMEWNAQQDQGRSFAEGVAELSKQFPHYADLIQAYHDHWRDSLGHYFSDTVNLMKRLKAAGYRLYGLSNWSAETLPYVRQNYDFLHLLDDFVISGAVGHRKPSPEIFQILLAKIEEPAQQCLFIDDSRANIEQARKMGFVTVLFESAEQLEKELWDLNLL
jgi:2-haloacid dehalogenase